jgi:hypothetical protein
MNDYLKERELWWPVSPKLIAEYNDGSHTHGDGSPDWMDWYKNSQLHRDGDKPARIDSTGRLVWYKNGQYHRDGDRPAVICATGDLEWWKNGLCHRDGDKPASIGTTGSLGWWKNNLRHRTTGPAIICPNDIHEYWINGVDITAEVNAWLKSRKYKAPFTPEQQVEFTLTFT